MNRQQLSLIIRFFILSFFICLVGFISWYFFPHIINLLREPEQLRLKLLAYGNWSRAVFIGLQIIQVVVAPLPGELVQMAGGYIYGIFNGTLYSMIGILLGSLIAFYLSRWLGYPLLQALIKKETLEKFKFLMDTNRVELVIFLLFLIPGAPKDILTFIAGITPIRTGSFFIAAMLGRFPGIIVSALFGAQLEKQDYLLVGLISCVIVFVFLLGIMYRDKLIHFISRFHSSKSHS